MIYSFTADTQTIAANATIQFNSNSVFSCPCVQHAAGAGAFTINSPGTYLISFNADANAAAAGDIIAQLHVNDNPYKGAVATATITTANTETANLSLTALVRVCPNCNVINSNLPTIMTVRNIGIAANFTTAAITIIRLG